MAACGFDGGASRGLGGFNRQGLRFPDAFVLIEVDPDGDRIPIKRTFDRGSNGFPESNGKQVRGAVEQG